MIVNNGSPQYHMSLDGQHSFFDQYGCRAVLVWLSSRMFRSGHKLILQVIACMAAVLLLTHSLPQRASDVALGRGYSDWIGWARGKASEAVGDASEAAGLRVVVFGASDIATLPDTKKGDMAWPEVMCEELECTTYISLVPKPPTRSLSSNSLYAAVVDELVQASPKDKAASPGRDYSFYPDHFPVPWHVPDFGMQVSEFLSRPQPSKSPKETIWVFNFGHWDVWNLAGLPLKRSQVVVDAMVKDVIVNIEKLFKASSNETSIAYSNFRARDDSSRPDYLPKLRQPAVTVGDGAKAIPDQQVGEPFRIIVPMIFDATLSPGWKTERPDLPPAHSKAEQMRNAATLTERWNNKLQNAIEEWVRTSDRESARQAEEEEEEAAASQPTTTAQSGADSATSAAAAPSSTVPLVRDAIIYDLQEYVTEMIAERQLHDHGYVDQNGVGGRPEDKMFREVASPCINAGSDKPKTINTSLAVPKDDEDANRPTSRRRSMRVARDAAKNPDEGVAQSSAVCKDPTEHLFYNSLSLSSRAIDDIGKETAELVVANMTLRGFWANSS
ncbi:hypothetical protein MGG_08927 [Pyricularia oryzae 70-15]|uniref:Uncharacterized protein n=3 Tax=Pyricularia oryzae TaxID=318829 RepID=G4MVZ8_PYRO7|nr:uncharacterized protein MGG_08927 [Pyricularia oryzae 70-15]EHA54151.1 hypothetical protein MGG_08927 [Pyricularia oryzae 70-15]ELQ42009.1 hypothetical protein OOU_Y34scaffold00240g16 [Pyricularia oryzae Y34]KAI7930833.1 hypothetical protein M9X92_000513 [Pyricularia oryzae]KAI7932432.1 hypothetical protein M0657_000562 [Pyricularia oryzae]